MKHIFKTLAFTTVLMASAPAASAYTIDEIAGTWNCAVLSKGGSMLGSFGYKIETDGTATLEGWMDNDDGWSYQYMSFVVGFSLRLNGDEIWETPTSVNIRVAEVDGFAVTPEEKAAMEKGLMAPPDGPSYIRYVKPDEFVFGDVDTLSACGRL